jgi:hypothetical protein
VNAGLVVVIAGTWVLAQVLKGNALGRLGIAGEPSPTAAGDSGGFKIPWPINPGGPVGGAAAGGAQAAGSVLGGRGAGGS